MMEAIESRMLCRFRRRRTKSRSWSGCLSLPLSLIFHCLVFQFALSRELKESDLTPVKSSLQGKWPGLAALAKEGTPAAASLLAAAAAASTAPEDDGRLDGALHAAELQVLERHRMFPPNISGTYKGTWEVVGNHSLLPFQGQHASGNIIFQIKAASTSRSEVHFLQGEVVLRDGMYISDSDLHMKLEGVYAQPWGQLRMMLSSGTDGDVDWEEPGPTSAAYHWALHDTATDRARIVDGKGAAVEIGKNCRVRMVAHVSPTVWEWKNAHREHVPSEILGVIENAGSWGDGEEGGEEEEGRISGRSLSISNWGGSGLHRPLSLRQLGEEEERAQRSEGNKGEARGAPPRSGPEEEPCFATLRVNATAVDLDAFYNKAVNYTLMVTFISFLQVLFIIRQMEHSNTQTGAAKVSMLMVGQQAIMDAYLCLLHLTAGIVVESLFNAFATAAFFKFVIFSIFEMRYLLAIWKARRPANTADSWDVMRRELSVLYSRFYGFLLGGILLIYRFNSILRYLLLFFYSFWIPQIVTSVARESRKPLHLHYVLGISLTRLAIPLYIFGCPRNFMRIEPSYAWCALLVAFMAAQVAVLLLQHHFGPRCFIPRQFLPEKYCYFRRLDCPPRGSSRDCGGFDNEQPAADCVICMAPVHLGPAHSTERMVTPCDHAFHARCLQRWMDIKMECPTCRRALPPL